MEIKVVSSTFPPEIQNVLTELLKYLNDPVEIRNNLLKYFKDTWIVVKGLSFAYSVSKANKSAGLFKNCKTSFFYLIYSPPYIEISPNLNQANLQSTDWKVRIVKKDEKEDSKISTEVTQILKSVNYDDNSSACNYIKHRVHKIKENFWHVFVGKDFVCSLPNNGVEFLLYAKGEKKKESLDIVVFRKQGVQRTVDLLGFFKVTGMVLLTFFFFLGIIGYLRCREGDSTWLCQYYSPFLYVGLTFIFAKSYGMLVGKLRR